LDSIDDVTPQKLRCK